MYQNLLIYFAMIIIAVAAYVLLKQRILVFLKQKNMVVENYMGKQIVTGGGLLLLFPCLLAVFPKLLIEYKTNYIFYILIVLSLTFSGILDDILGDSSAKGIIGHTRCFIKGGFSTGIMKALTGGIIGILLALSRYETPIGFFLDIIMFPLCINLINLLDLRPGRAIKGFSTLLFLIAISSGFKEIWIVLPMITSLCCYLKGEMEERYMLGDTGANLIGGILGFYAVITLPMQGKLILTIFLITIQLFAEFYSLSRWIDTIPLLRKIDQFGKKNWR